MAPSFSDGVTGSPGRISSRHLFEAKIRIRIERNSKQLSLPGWARDLSETGLSGFVAEALTLGEVVTLEIPMSDSDHEAIPAKVVRVLGTEVGFQFTALSANQRRRIQATLKGRPAIPYHGKRP
jgi:hypothetical protein